MAHFSERPSVSTTSAPLRRPSDRPRLSAFIPQIPPRRIAWHRLAGVGVVDVRGLERLGLVSEPSSFICEGDCADPLFQETGRGAQGRIRYSAGRAPLGPSRPLVLPHMRPQAPFRLLAPTLPA